MLRAFFWGTVCAVPVWPLAYLYAEGMYAAGHLHRPLASCGAPFWGLLAVVAAAAAWHAAGVVWFAWSDDRERLLRRLDEAECRLTAARVELGWTDEELWDSAEYWPNTGGNDHHHRWN